MRVRSHNIVWRGAGWPSGASLKYSVESHSFSYFLLDHPSAHTLYFDFTLHFLSIIPHEYALLDLDPHLLDFCTYFFYYTS
jgi:hypothetical protein